MATEHHHNHANDHHGTVREYIIGLILSLVLTIIPFALVKYGNVGDVLTISLILLCACGQVFVQLIFFLHMGLTEDQLWTNASTALVVILMAILVVGSLWIMNHLNHNMLLGH